MALDTTQIDALIAKQQINVDNAKIAVDSCQLAVLEQEKIQLDGVRRSEQAILDELVSKKNQAISAQEISDQKSQEAIDIKSDIEGTVIK